MSHDQLARLRHAVTDLQADGRLDRRIGMMFLLLAATGLRPSEALALRPGDVDVVGHRLRVERSMNPDGSVKSTKTKEIRTVDLSDRLTAALKDYLSCLDLDAALAGRGDPAWLFPSAMGPFDERNLRKILARVLNHAALPHFRVYDLRHTFASLLLSEGVPLVYVSGQLGHAKPTSTLRYYARWIPSGDKRYANMLDGASQEVWHQNLAPSPEKCAFRQRTKHGGG